MSDRIPAVVADFVRERIGSIAELELLLLLSADPSRAWTAEDAAKGLYMAMTAVSDLLEQLRRQGILQLGPAGYRYRPQSPQLEAAIAQVAEQYQLRRLAIIELIYSRPSGKIQSIADAFRFWKKPSEDA
jgi:hypothetical protein